MTIDFDDILLGPIYASGLATPATLTPQGSPGGNYSIRVIDCTAGAGVEDTVRGGHITVETIRPTARMQQSELNAISLILADLEGAELKIRDVTWRIKAYQVKPMTPGAGEIELILLDRDS
jgi:hypothetical protein